MQILIVATSVTPFAPHTDLAEFTQQLATSLANRHHDVTLFSLFFPSITIHQPLARRLTKYTAPSGDTSFTFSIYETKLPGSNVNVTLIAADPRSDTTPPLLPETILHNASLVLCEEKHFFPSVVHLIGTSSNKFTPSWGERRTSQGRGIITLSTEMSPSEGSSFPNRLVTTRIFDEERSTLPISTGIDTQAWNAPSSDEKTTLKRAIREQYRLADRPGALVLVPIESDMEAMRFFQLYAQNESSLLTRSQFLILAKPISSTITDQLEQLSREYSRSIGVTSLDEANEIRRTFVGSDAILILEDHADPWTLHLKAAQSGAVPIVPDQTRLAETLVHLDSASGTGNALLWDRHHDGLVRELHRFLEMYEANSSELSTLRQNAIRIPYTWDETVARYEALYR